VYNVIIIHEQGVVKMGKAKKLKRYCFELEIDYDEKDKSLYLDGSKYENVEVNEISSIVKSYLDKNIDIYEI